MRARQPYRATAILPVVAVLVALCNLDASGQATRVTISDLDTPLEAPPLPSSTGNPFLPPEGSSGTWIVITDNALITDDGQEQPSEPIPPPQSIESTNNQPSDASATQQPAASDTSSQRRSSRFDPQVVARGQAAFQTSCTMCHEPERALEKRKDLAGWLATVRRMAQMDGAEIANSDIRPIATYLASLSAPAEESGGEGTPQDDQAGRAADTAESDSAAIVGSGLSTSGTISTIWRGGNDNLQNPGFFPDVWLRADWQPEGALRARVTVCTSCHSDALNDSGFTFELVEGVAHYDLLHWLRKDRPEEQVPDRELQVGLSAGRFVVPFGGFASKVHPGIYRTVTQPLLYNMGRNVAIQLSRPPVLPMPYSDEGVGLDADIPLWLGLNATLDAYAVNGLQGFGPGVQFSPSRSYTDNNSEPATGGRVTIGNECVRVGGSIMSGRMQDEGLAPLDYRLAGGDATFRYQDLLRYYFEYAIRENDTNNPRRQIVYGTVHEVELLLLSEPNISLLARYDNLEYRDFFGNSSVERFTWGVNTVLPGGSLLMINHERWNFDEPQPTVDVIGFRWVATF